MDHNDPGGNRAAVVQRAPCPAEPLTLEASGDARATGLGCVGPLRLREIDGIGLA